MKSKNDGQVFTPVYIVDQMFELCGLVDDGLMKYKIIEPSFGNGAFLLRIFEKMVEYARKNHMLCSQLYEIIKENLFGIEKDNALYVEVVNKIYCILAEYAMECDEEFEITLCDNFICGDTLEINRFDGKMDIVLGNPPWVRYHNIQDQKEREFIKSYSFSANGNTDIYITFFEKGLQMLNNGGKLCFITPNSYFNSKMDSVMRKYITDNKMLKTIVNFGHKQIFDGFTTYSCITLLTKQPCEKTLYIQNDVEKQLAVNDYYLNDNFYFNANGEFADIINYSGERYVKVKNGCATLMDKFFIGNKEFQNSVFNKPAIKASTGQTTFCFYPYDENGEIVMLDEIQYLEPNVVKYLEENKEMLLNRDIDKGTPWYGFGRSQAIQDTHKKKFVLNTLYSKKEDVRLARCPDVAVVYGGIYILGPIKQEILEEILYSDKYIQYVKTIGKYKSDGYYTLGSKEVENFINFSLLKHFQNAVNHNN